MVGKNLVYLAYGNVTEYRRAVFSILSFRAWNTDLGNSVRIILYTDAPDYFRSFFADDEIEYYLLNPQLLIEMSGPDNFNHRIKVKIISLTFEKYPDLDLLFIDSDTFFMTRAEVLFKKLDVRQSFMHIREYPLAKAVENFSAFNQGHFPIALIDYISKNDFEVAGQKMHFTPDDYNWNAGVLGLSSNFGTHMSDVLKLTDQLYAHTKWFVCEQLAFSFTLQRLTEIQPANNFIYHYWGKRQKVVFDRFLQKYFSSDTPNRDNQQIRNTTTQWKKRIDNDLILEQIEIAKSTRSWFYAGKKVVRFVLANGINVSPYKELVKSLSPGKSLSQLE